MNGEALCACEAGGTLVYEKQQKDRMTIAVAKGNGELHLMKHNIYLVGMGKRDDDRGGTKSIRSKEMSLSVIQSISNC